MKRTLHFLTYQTLLVPGIFLFFFLPWQWHLGNLQFESLEGACRSLWPYIGAFSAVWIGLCVQAGTDLKKSLSEERDRRPTLYLPTNRPYPPKNVVWPAVLMTILFCIPALAFFSFVSYESLLWIQPWRLAQLSYPLPDVPPSPKPNIPKSPAGPSSYLAFEGNPVFTGTSPTNTEGTAFSVGDPIAFNIHFRATGPNPVKGLAQACGIEIVTDLFHTNNGLYDQKIIDGAVRKFLEEMKREAHLHKSPFPGHTLMPGDREFFTAYAWKDNYTAHRILSQNDLDSSASGLETWVVISIITYSDGMVIHHLRRCFWLAPPATPQSVWHFCGDSFPDSD